MLTVRADFDSMAIVGGSALFPADLTTLMSILQNGEMDVPVCLSATLPAACLILSITGGLTNVVP
ncbi:hypothetical protein DRH29_00170 [candidate division Kazan bacterium]|uniref:Uncharacterized protein n=1 Tax=candidate division Kazan bacterium TaxID=2202143 RepID=A0A420ZE01_UNCK3|nr:MAG: hypothetical protein DRH29_00170 [candidate division Kazan bacterium]